MGAPSLSNHGQHIRSASHWSAQIRDPHPVDAPLLSIANVSAEDAGAGLPLLDRRVHTGVTRGGTVSARRVQT
jgi:hypothetical protein